MLGSVAIGAGWAKKQVEALVEGVFDGVEAAGAEDLKAAFIGRTDTDIVDRLVRPAVLDDEVGTAVDGERLKLADIEAVFYAARFVGEIELEGLPFEVDNCNQHGSVPRGMECGGGLVSPVGMELDYHLNGKREMEESSESIAGVLRSAPRDLRA
jgi:hypothetical protein